MQRLKTPLEIFLWTIGILFGIVTLLFILSYFVFYVLFSSAPQDWGLRGVQLQDKPYLAGIDDLSPNAFVFATTGEDAPDYVITLDNTYFKWGDFRLNKLSLNSNVVRINDLVRLGKQHDTDLGMPETISINGQSCLSRGSFVFVRIKGKEPSMPYSDFTLASCEIPEGEVILPTIRLKTKVAFYENRQLNYDYLWKDNELISSQIKQAHSYNTNFIEPSLQVQLANDKDKFDIWWYYTDLTNHAKLIQVVHGDYMDEASRERNFVIGECRYKLDNTRIYLTDLTKDTAHWHFIDDFDSGDISDKCKMQILPYRLVKR